MNPRGGSGGRHDQNGTKRRPLMRALLGSSRVGSALPVDSVSIVRGRRDKEAGSARAAGDLQRT